MGDGRQLIRPRRRAALVAALAGASLAVAGGAALHAARVTLGSHGAGEEGRAEALPHVRERLARFERSEPHMGTTFEIVLYAPDAAHADRAVRAAFARIAGLDGRLSDYRPDSELMRLSRDAAGRAVPVSPDLFRILCISRHLSARTGGAFDVTAGALTRLWRRAHRVGELPRADAIAAAQDASGYRLMQLRPEGRAVLLDRAGMRLDLGGIAKGYAADRALQALREHGVDHALVAAGGDVSAADPPPGQRGWRVDIAPFGNTPAPDAPLIVANHGVSTSGDAEQWVQIDGVRYSHIVDPRSGWPLTGRRTVTVVARDATTSDMLATAISVLGPEAGLRLADDTAGAAALIGTIDGTGVLRWAASRDWVPVAGAAAR